MINKTKHDREYFRDWFPIKFKKRAKNGETKIVQRRFILTEGLTDRFTVVSEKSFIDCGVPRRTIGVLKRVSNKWLIVSPFVCVDNESFDDLRKAIRRLYKHRIGKK